VIALRSSVCKTGYVALYSTPAGTNIFLKSGNIEKMLRFETINDYNVFNRG